MAESSGVVDPIELAVAQFREFLCQRGNRGYFRVDRGRENDQVELEVQIEASATVGTLSENAHQTKQAAVLAATHKRRCVMAVKAHMTFVSTLTNFPRITTAMALVLITVAIGFESGLSQVSGGAVGKTESSRGAFYIDDERINSAEGEPENWLAYGRTYEEQRFSPLDQINRKTVSRLGLTWRVDMESSRGLEATPIVVDGVMFLTSEWSKVYAINAKTGEQIWFYDPEVPGDWGRKACCDVVNRGVAVYQGKVYVGSVGANLIQF